MIAAPAQQHAVKVKLVVQTQIECEIRASASASAVSAYDEAIVTSRVGPIIAIGESRAKNVGQGQVHVWRPASRIGGCSVGVSIWISHNIINGNPVDIKLQGVELIKPKTVLGIFSINHQIECGIGIADKQSAGAGCLNISTGIGSQGVPQLLISTAAGDRQSCSSRNIEIRES
ncbi:MAG TPA: hypothetical protein VFF11_11280 [Candidatus Binatia bacterium]|nr:hypothetical protein [Candidatus Binatia bacterium]